MEQREALFEKHSHIDILVNNNAVSSNATVCNDQINAIIISKSLSKLTIGTEVTVHTIMPGPTLSENVYQIIDGMYPDEALTFSEKEKTSWLKTYRNLKYSDLLTLMK